MKGKKFTEASYKEELANLTVNRLTKDRRLIQKFIEQLDSVEDFIKFIEAQIGPVGELAEKVEDMESLAMMIIANITDPYKQRGWKENAAQDD